MRKLRKPARTPIAIYALWPEEEAGCRDRDRFADAFEAEEAECDRVQDRYGAVEFGPLAFGRNPRLPNVGVDAETLLSRFDPDEYARVRRGADRLAAARVSVGKLPDWLILDLFSLSEELEFEPLILARMGLSVQEAQALVAKQPAQGGGNCT